MAYIRTVNQSQRASTGQVIMAIDQGQCCFSAEHSIKLCCV